MVSPSKFRRSVPTALTAFSTFTNVPPGVRSSINTFEEDVAHSMLTAAVIASK
jgi:hypothetical protein